MPLKGVKRIRLKYVLNGLIRELGNFDSCFIVLLKQQKYSFIFLKLLI